ncbi:mycothiol conjugate amidase Mca [Canibacter zhoujuaniae]|uniref:mycothiol conjugate amidase Mca n=1 Tax=Canibacter zhoujuaniae TaxID=2708343 RepID=UPI001FBBAE49|nr:mycothiol conjugate amidase Mca [Canibacter zhoujuaniae]
MSITMSLRLLAVHAHPDDESSKGAATYAHYLNLGCKVMIVSCTGGERGDILNEIVRANPEAERDLAGLRRAEMRRAQEIIGFEHRWLGFQDSGLPEAGEALPELSFAAIRKETAAAPLIKIVREFKPHVMLTYNEIGGYPHPDHIRCHEISRIAWEESGKADSYPEAGKPWEVKKLYYDEIFNADRIAAIKAHIEANDPDSEQVKELTNIFEILRERKSAATAKISVADYFDLRDEALRAHASQVSPNDRFFFIENELQRAAWPFEDYRLAESRVPTSDSEDDLFAGIEGNA